MSDDWKPGDLALCVKSAPEFHGLAGWGRVPGPRAGAVYTVNDVRVFPHFADAVGLMVTGFSVWLDADCFRKIDPLSIEERNAELRLLDEPTPVDAISSLEDACRKVWPR